jgi:hemolysin D
MIELIQYCVPGTRSKTDERESLKRIVSPVAGTVQQLTLHTVGGMIEPGQQLMAIVPDDAGIEIEAMVQNQDIGFVHAGEEAVVKLEAFPFTRYGTVPGELKTVSDDAVSAPSQSDGPSSDAQRAKGDAGASASSPVYTARVTLDRTTMNIDGKPVRLEPGMAATVEIKTGKRKLIEFLLSPLMRMSDEAGRER